MTVSFKGKRLLLETQILVVNWNSVGLHTGARVDNEGFGYEHYEAWRIDY